MDLFSQRVGIGQELSRGGEWLAAARSWMQSNVMRGDTLTWSSGELVQIPFCKLEDFAKRVAVAAVLEDRQRRKGSTSPLTEVQTRELCEQFTMEPYQVRAVEQALGVHQ